VERQRPSRAESDRLEVRTKEQAGRRSDAETLLWDALSRTHTADNRGVAAYEKSLTGLRKRAGELPEAAAAIERSHPADSMVRWSLYYVLADLHHPELAAVLVKGATRDLPQITEATACETVEEGEILVAAMAVEGLERLAATEPEVAIAALTDVIDQQPHVAIRTAAVQALLNTRPEAAKEVVRALPEDQRWILDARRVSVDQVSALPERTRPSRVVTRGPKLESDVSAPTIDRQQE
jgi:hypothetical protein